MELKSCTVYRGGQGEVIEKKSRFIATIEPREADQALYQAKKKGRNTIVFHES